MRMKENAGTRGKYKYTLTTGFPIGYCLILPIVISAEKLLIADIPASSVSASPQYTALLDAGGESIL